MTVMCHVGPFHSVAPPNIDSYLAVVPSGLIESNTKNLYLPNNAVRRYCAWLKVCMVIVTTSCSLRASREQSRISGVKRAFRVQYLWINGSSRILDSIDVLLTSEVKLRVVHTGYPLL